MYILYITYLYRCIFFGEVPGLLRMEKRSRKRQVDEKRLEEITLIAEEIVAKKGINGLTLQEVISNSSISRGTFINSFHLKKLSLPTLALKGLTTGLA